MPFALLGTSNKSDLAPAWVEVVGDRDFESATFADFGLGDVCLGMLHFRDGSYEVGQGEALRPYIQHYAGSDAEEASQKFIEKLAQSSDGERGMEVTPGVYACLGCGLTVTIAEGDEFPRDDEKCQHEFEPIPDILSELREIDDEIVRLMEKRRSICDSIRE